MCRYVSPSVPGAHLQVRSFKFLDQHEMLVGFSGGTRRCQDTTGKMKWEHPTLGGKHLLICFVCVCVCVSERERERER